MRIRHTPAVRFWRRVVKSEGCWEWAGPCNEGGYGRVTWNHRRVAHRISWEMAYGPIPEGLFVLHHCDNRRCVRPEHLFLGTANDNIQDMNAKGRARGGRKASVRVEKTKPPSIHIAIINHEAALPRLKRVAVLLGAGLNQSDIGRVLGVSRERARQLVNRARDLGLIEDAKCP